MDRRRLRAAARAFAVALIGVLIALTCAVATSPASAATQVTMMRHYSQVFAG